MDFSTKLMIGLLSGAIGTSYIVYGKKQQKPIPLFAGIALAAVPYFAPSIMWAVIFSILLMALPFFVKY